MGRLEVHVNHPEYVNNRKRNAESNSGLKGGAGLFWTVCVCYTMSRDDADIRCHVFLT